MSQTPYTQEFAAFTNEAHKVATQQFYPQCFGVPTDRITWDGATLLDSGTRGQVLDGEMAIDHIARVKLDGLNAPLQVTIQERFRQPEFERFDDVTITEWNHRTGKPSELHKIAANLFVYGYYDQTQRVIMKAVALSVPHVLLFLLTQSAEAICASRCGTKKDQTFLRLTTAQIRDNGLAVYDLNWLSPAPWNPTDAELWDE